VINTEINSFVEKINKNKIRVNQKNIKYHTISVFLDNDEFQITSLRNDLKTYGRSADVNFVDSVYIDAKRRDFTINALYLDYEGNLIDPYNGYQDIIDKNLKFIGSPIERLKEDYLRIFRYCRFF
jgi:tRNA nucleotidyltransferase/poly(A) polymerase